MIHPPKSGQPFWARKGTYTLPFKGCADHFSELIIHDGLSRITKISLKCKAPGDTAVFEPKFETEVFETPMDGFGLYFEADAVARDLRGKPCSSIVVYLLNRL